MIQNVTAQRELEIKEQNAARQLAAIMGNIEGGITATVYHSADDLELVFANDGFYGLFGYTAEQWNAEVANIVDPILPEDRAETLATVARLFRERKSATYEYRCRKRDGGVIWIRTINTVLALEGVGDTVLLAVSTDVTVQKQTEQQQTELLDNMPCGAGVYEYKNGAMNFIYQNKSYWELVGLNKADFPDNSEMSAIHPEDIGTVMRELSLALSEKRDVSCDIRLRHLTLGYRPVHLAGRIVMEAADALMIYATFTPLPENA